MDRSKLIFWRNFLGITFLVSLPVAIILFTVTYALWNTWMLTLGFLHTDEKSIADIVMITFSFLRIFIVFGLLCPFLALHLMIKRSKK